MNHYYYSNPRFRLGAVAMWVLLGAFPLWADSTLDVQCVDQSGSPVAGAQVFVQHLNTGKPREKKSDGKGRANFTNLEDGVYRVVARKEGFEPALHEFVPLKGSAQQSATVQFKPGDVKKQLYFESEALHQKSIDLLTQGTTSLQANKFAEAEKQLRDSLEINPSNPDTTRNLAIAYLQQQKWQEGEQALKRTAELAGALAELPQTGGATGPNPYQEIRQQVEALAAKLPHLKVRGEGDKALAEKRFEDAIVKYKEALQSEKDADLYHNMAVALANTKKYDEAIEAADQALKLKPQEKVYQDLKKQIADYKQNEGLMKAQGVLEQGNKMFEQGDFAGALKQYEEIMPTIPEKNQPVIWFQIGRTQAKLKQPDKAIQAFKRAMELAPENADYRNALAQYYLDEKRGEEALEVYSDPKGAGSQSPEQALFAMGEKLSNQGNSQVAQVAFEKVLKLNPQNAEAYYQLGMIHYYDKKNDKRATELLTKYLEIGTQKDHLENTRSVLVVLKKRMSKPK
jgi:tetratricopeptide (TPR) repeat protein